MMRSMLAFAVVLLSQTVVCGEPADTNYDETKVPDYVLPELLVDQAGKAVSTKSDWMGHRRQEVMRLFEDHVYGRTPQEKLPVAYEVIESDEQALDGLATRKQISLVFAGKLKLDLLIYLPNASDGRVPAFLGLNFYGNQTVHPDPAIRINPRWMRANEKIGIVNHRASERTRGVYAERWQVESVLRRGYALATLYCGDVDPDTYNHDFTDGVHPLFYAEGQDTTRPGDWGTIGAWAWGLSRVLDYLADEAKVDEGRVAVIGHSRLGKTALWAGAQDQRFAMVISNNSGCGGAALYRRCYGERIHHMVKPIGYWFCKHHLTYAKREAELPVDQHMLVALLAPRPVYIASAVEDRWADPVGEYLAGKHAAPVYALYDKPTLAETEFPSLNRPLRSTVSYHIRAGAHDVTSYDWKQYLDFADEQLR